MVFLRRNVFFRDPFVMIRYYAFHVWHSAIAYFEIASVANFFGACGWDCQNVCQSIAKTPLLMFVRKCSTYAGATIQKHFIIFYRTVISFWICHIRRGRTYGCVGRVSIVFFFSA